MKIQKEKNKNNPWPLLMAALLLFMGASLYGQELGDTNNDGNINIVDALLVARYYVGLNADNFYPNAADTSGNGKIEITDALLIAQFYVNLITSFPGQNTGTPIPQGEGLKAAFTISNTVPSINERVYFDASLSTASSGQSIISYEWDFDDGTTGSGIQVSHSFSEMDDFNVKLTVTETSGAIDDRDERVFVGRPQGWTKETHHKSADADYELLFPEDSVPRLDITITAQDFQTMQNNLRTLNMMSTENPVYVKSTVKFNGFTWWNVGIRYKGFSSLMMANQAGKKKLPLRLNFDKLEDDYPEIKNQRFYGFSEMTFSNNWYDPTYLHDRICGEIFRENGIPAAVGGFARIYIDTGSGPVYWGLYTMIEDPSDQMKKYQFDDDEGNLYKPEGTGADFTTFRQDVYVKKTNEDEADYSDIQAMISSLNASRTNAAQWRSNLERVFDARGFIRWLASNTTVVNFDTYGWVTKNYYVYQNLADNGRLVWIPWDLNFAMSETNPWNIAIPSLSLSEIGRQWPLIRFLMDDPVYNDLYHQEMTAVLNGAFNEAKILAKIEKYAALIRPYIQGETAVYSFLDNGVSQFDQAIRTLNQYITSRHSQVRNYLNSR
ncbi:MAG: CotH kinase family protein [Spirochaetales bacterium]|nr:CotH kinase family protein [Spirochaetales bacterium]